MINFQIAPTTEYEKNHHGIGILVCLSTTALAKDEQLLVAGDSWAMFMCLYNSFPEVFLAHGYFAKVDGCNGATRFGGRADEWSTYPANTVMMDDLKKDVYVTTVYLSMGGNDFFANWNTSLTPDQELAAFKKIAAGIQTIIDSIFKIRPDVRISYFRL